MALDKKIKAANKRGAKISLSLPPAKKAGALRSFKVQERKKRVAQKIADKINLINIDRLSGLDFFQGQALSRTLSLSHLKKLAKDLNKQITKNQSKKGNKKTIISILEMEDKARRRLQMPSLRQQSYYLSALKMSIKSGNKTLLKRLLEGGEHYNTYLYERGLGAENQYLLWMMQPENDYSSHFKDYLHQLETLHPIDQLEALRNFKFPKGFKESEWVKINNGLAPTVGEWRKAENVEQPALAPKAPPPVPPAPQEKPRYRVPAERAEKPRYRVPAQTRPHHYRSDGKPVYRVKA